jgi:hypothetical protein
MAVEPELTAHGILFCVLYFYSGSQPFNLTSFFVHFLIIFCIVRNSPNTYICIPKRIKMTVKYKYTRKMYVQVDPLIRGFTYPLLTATRKKIGKLKK